MIIDCDTCVARDIACDDCVVSVLLGPPGAARHTPEPAAGPGAAVDLDDAERAALGMLADVGLVPRLRLVPVVSPKGREIA